jgi:hypothetical protein
MLSRKLKEIRKGKFNEKIRIKINGKNEKSLGK